MDSTDEPSVSAAPASKNEDSSQPEQSIEHQMVSHATTFASYYIPPVNYGLVEDDLYRSGQPNELNFPFLERLGLKNVLYLASEDPPQS